MTSLQVKGHERPIAKIKFDDNGDVLFSLSKDKRITLWHIENGEKIGTYHGHKENYMGYCY